MKRRDFNRFALGIGLSLILANAATAQVVAQREAVAQPPSKNVVAERSDGRSAQVRQCLQQ